jgi:L-ascorbate metabolism protein UlaG (beta-lactamase superfamily)
VGALLLAATACSAPYDPGPSGELSQAVPDNRLTARFFGVGTVLLSDGRTGVMTDGFFSRPALLQGLAPLRPNEPAIDWALRRGAVEAGTVRAVLVAHSHYDHALDTATVAEKLGAKVVGSVSTCRIVRAQNFPRERTVLIEGGERLGFDSSDFKVKVFRSEHTPPPPWPIPPLKGDVDPGFKVPARITEYEQGGTYSFLVEHRGHTVLIHSSTNFRKGMYAGVRADVVFLGVALLSRQSDRFAKDYWQEVVAATGAKLVIPVHWDDFERPLDKPIRFLGWPDDVEKDMAMVRSRAQASGVKVAFMRLFEPVDVLAAAHVDSAGPESLPSPPVLRRPPTCPD